MKKYQQWLVILLSAQLLLAAAIFTVGKFGQSQVKLEPLLSGTKAEIDQLVFSDATKKVTLKKSANEWQIGELKQLPADKQKVEDLLAKLEATQLRWPVTNTKSSHERFEVADAKFQRKVEYYQGDKKRGNFYLGTSPGFKQIHLRNGSEDKVYVAELTQTDFSNSPSDWLSKTLISATNIKSIKGQNYEITKTNNQWALANSQEKLDVGKVEALVASLTTLQAIDIVDEPQQADKVTLDVVGDSTWHYEFLQKDNSAYVKRSDRNQWFKINPEDFTKITGVKLSDMILKQDQKPTAP